MIVKMYIADQLCYEYIFEPHFRWYESMILLTLLTPCIFSFVNLYIYIVYYGLFHPYHDKKSTFSFVWTVHQKNYLPASDQAVFVRIPIERVVSCVLNHKPLIVHQCSQFWLSFPLCNHTFIQGSRSHRSA